MTLVFKNGDMFSEPVEALVNTVNCVGVMGKGVALEVKKRWPENYRAYKKLCDAQGLRPGKMFVFDTRRLFTADGPRYIINFPTKDHWRGKSKLSFVSEGLDAFVDAIRQHGIKSVALPPLGCGNGGLDWADVRELITAKLSQLDGVKIVVFPPKDAVDEPEYVNAALPMTYGRAVLLKALGDMETYFSGAFDRISLQKIAYFLQMLGVKLNLEFSRDLHGPYSEALRKAYVTLEKNKMISGFATGNRQAHVTPAGYAAADEFLSKQSVESDVIIERLDRLIQGYENPYGLELLSSVHWLAVHENHYPVDRIVEALQSWSETKRNSFSEDAIRVAYARLVEDELISPPAMPETVQ